MQRKGAGPRGEVQKLFTHHILTLLILKNLIHLHNP